MQPKADLPSQGEFDPVESVLKNSGEGSEEEDAEEEELAWSEKDKKASIENVLAAKLPDTADRATPPSVRAFHLIGIAMGHDGFSNYLKDPDC